MGDEAPSGRAMVNAGPARQRGGARMFAALAVCLAASVLASMVHAAEPLPRSLLIINQSTALRPWSNTLIAGIQAGLGGIPFGTISLYVENLDLYRFDSPQYRKSLQTHFREKYRDRPIGVIVAIGQGGLAAALELRASLWPGTPVVFAAVEKTGVLKNLPPDVTGSTLEMRLDSMLDVAQVVVPNLKRFAVVGNPPRDQLYYKNFFDDLSKQSSHVELIDLTGMPLNDVRDRVATLPDDSAIFYIGLRSDPQRTFVSGAQALPLIADVANRPIIIDTETFFGTGAVGGFLLSPEEIGRDAGRTVLRLLTGESASDIPVSVTNRVKPVFDWRQLKRWHVNEANLPPGSEIRFRETSVWEQYFWEIALVAVIIALQMALIIGLLYEHRRRRLAEAMARSGVLELAHMNRLATAGELSASIAHEINQPLTGIVAHANAGLRWLGNERPNLEEARGTFKQIAAAGHHAAEVIERIRAFFRKGSSGGVEPSLINVNNVIRETLSMIATDLRGRKVAIETDLAEELPLIIGDRVQLQQVILNLAVNSADAMGSITGRDRILRVSSRTIDGDGVLVRVEDSGPGIEQSDLDRIFEPFYTTKPRAMGMGLSISRSIAEAHQGRLWAKRGDRFGTIFNLELPGVGAEPRAAHPIVPKQDRESEVLEAS